MAYRVAKAYALAGDRHQYETLAAQVRRDLQEQREYYESMSLAMRYYIPYVTEPLYQLDSAMRMPIGTDVCVTNDSNAKEVAHVD
jgi:hypothetical protein